MDDIKQVVRDNYGEIARRNAEGRREGIVTRSDAVAIGYDETDLTSVPEGANMGLGCGNPTAIAGLKPGETVLDLGSGGGFDCFLAANAVGPEGRVIGVDMTEAMICAARANAEKGGYHNVEFRLGEIEALPVDSSSVDVIISNCVINLVPDKAAAFAEAFRVLKPGGRLHVSDIVLGGDAPQEILESVAAYVNCVAGAVSREEYLSRMAEAGFVDITVECEKDAANLLNGCCSTDDGEGCCCSSCDALPEAPEGLVISITVSATKPTGSE
ncbi:MAG: arsenite methyltransferase [Armatimonadetes bacterium]|nr:arsenite methyltransferase [Armatimonadota bacterium]